MFKTSSHATGSMSHAVMCLHSNLVHQTMQYNSINNVSSATLEYIQPMYYNVGCYSVKVMVILKLLCLPAICGYHQPNNFAMPAPSVPTAAPVATTGAATVPTATAPMVAAAAPSIPPVAMPVANCRASPRLLSNLSHLSPSSLMTGFFILPLSGSLVDSECAAL